MVVSRGLKLLRPILKVPSGVVIVASGSVEFDNPGSRSREYWKRNSLNHFGVIENVQFVVTADVLTLLFPVCSAELRVPEFSRLVPVKFCWLNRTQTWFRSLMLKST